MKSYPKSMFVPTMMALFVAITIVFTQTAFAGVKERGGGNVTANGKLADLEFVRSATSLTQEVDALLAKPLEQLLPVAPEFAALLFTKGLKGEETRYFLSTHEISDSDCALQSPVKIAAQIAACNIKISPTLSEVYVSKNVWASASEDARLDLIVHEQLRSHQLRLGAGSDVPLFRLTATVLDFLSRASAADTTVLEKEMLARRILQSSLEGGFGAYSLGLTVQDLTDVAVDAFTPLCDGRSEAWPLATERFDGATEFFRVLTSAVDVSEFVKNRKSACAALPARAREAFGSYRGRIDQLYPLFWR